MHRLTHLHISPILVALGALALLLVLSRSVTELEQERLTATYRAEIFNQVGTLRARLEGELNSTMLLTRGLIAVVSVNPAITQAEFVPLARELMHHSPLIRNIGLARDNVISHMYPMEGNESAVGLNYLETPKQRDAVIRLMENRETVVAGPLELVQGGTAIIGRTPIYVDSDSEGVDGAYWGLASIPLNLDILFKEAGVSQAEESLKIALRGRDAKGAQGEVFYGDPELFNRDAILLKVELPGLGSWQLAAEPLGGWGGRSSSLPWLQYGSTLLSLLLALMLYTLLHQWNTSRYLALHDGLTGLPNRRLFEDRMEQAILRAQRNEASFSLLYLDLDNFKPVNDTHGHKVGDHLLQQVGQRLLDEVRASDTVARIGGDEFMLILQEGNREAAEAVAKKLITRFRTPFLVDHHRIDISASIGIATYPDSANTTDGLIREADHAMYSVKADGKHNWRSAN